MKQLMSNGGVCRTALTKQSLLKMRLKNSPGNTVSVKYISKMFNNKKKVPTKISLSRIGILLNFSVPSNQTSLHFAVPSNQFNRLLSETQKWSEIGLSGTSY